MGGAWKLPEMAVKEGEKAFASKGNADAVSKGAAALSSMGHPDFAEGGSRAKLAREGFKPSAQKASDFKDTVKDISSLGKDHSPAALKKVMSAAFKSQAGHAMEDAGAAGFVGKELLGGSNSLLKRGVKAIEIVGSDMIHGAGIGQSIRAGVDELRGVANSSSRASMAYMNNGRASMIGGVQELQNAGQLHTLDQSAWNAIGRMDNGTMAQQIGFNPALMASGAMVAIPGQAMPQMAVPGGGTVPFANSGATAKPYDLQPGMNVAPLPGQDQEVKRGGMMSKLKGPLEMGALLMGGHELMKSGGVKALEEKASDLAENLGFDGVSKEMKSAFKLPGNKGIGVDGTKPGEVAKDHGPGASDALQAGNGVRKMAKSGKTAEEGTEAAKDGVKAAETASKGGGSIFDQIGKFGSDAMKGVEGVGSKIGGAVSDVAAPAVEAAEAAAPAVESAAPEIAALAL